MTTAQRKLLTILAEMPREQGAGNIARRYFAGQRCKSGHWQRMGAWLRKLGGNGWVSVRYDSDGYTPLFRITEKARDLLKVAV